MSEQVHDVDCRYCNGTGAQPELMLEETLAVIKWESGQVCEICHGKGMVRLQFDDTPTPTCGYCHGSGREAWMTYLSSDELPEGACRISFCFACKGFGRQSMTGDVTQIA